jgi:hypothetical protein
VGPWCTEDVGKKVKQKLAASALNSCDAFLPKDTFDRKRMKEGKKE